MYLFGAGASTEAGIPTANTITKTFLDYSTSCPCSDGPKIENLVRYVQVRIANRLQMSASRVDFEQVLGGLIELEGRSSVAASSLLGAGDELIREIEKDFEISKAVRRLYALLREQVADIDRVDYLEPFASSLKENPITECFTLNYDRCLETCFDKYGVTYTRGFDTTGLWDHTQFESEDVAVRLYKLHGSIDWARDSDYMGVGFNHYVDQDSMSRLDGYLGYYPFMFEFDHDYAGLVSPPNRAAGMRGVMNFGVRKEQMYASEEFVTLFSRFIKSLDVANTCIIVGYSFRDSFINLILEQAIVRRQGNLHIIVVDPAVSDILQYSPFLFRLRETRRATFIRGGFGDVLRSGELLQDLEDHFRAPAATNAGALVKFRGGTLRAGVALSKYAETADAWEQFGDLLPLTWFRLNSLDEALNVEIERLPAVDIATRCCNLLRPLAAKALSLSYGLSSVYESLGVSSSNSVCDFRRENLDRILLDVEISKASSDSRRLRVEIKKVWQTLQYVSAVYTNASDEFQSAIRDTKYGERISAPTQWSAAELVIRNLPSRLGEFVYCLNELFCLLGANGPFDSILFSED